jgi:CMP-N-acetylneuraminic acid synthetase
MTGLLAIVPARAGSKRVPGKNKALIAGLPVVDYTIAALETSRSTDGIVLSTDDTDIADRYRARASVFLVDRPPALAQDESTTASVVAHALDAWQGARRTPPRAILLAQPTTPLRTAADIDDAYSLFERTGAESVISACKAEGIRHPQVMYRLKRDGHAVPYEAADDHSTQRQSLDPVYQRNGAIYLVTAEFFLRTGRLRSDNPVIYEMPWERSINIDVPADLLIAKALIESGVLAPQKTK